MITFKQAQHILIKVKAEVVDYRLMLMPEGDRAAGLLLQKKG